MFLSGCVVRNTRAADRLTELLVTGTWRLNILYSIPVSGDTTNTSPPKRKTNSISRCILSPSLPLRDRKGRPPPSRAASKTPNRNLPPPSPRQPGTRAPGRDPPPSAARVSRHARYNKSWPRICFLSRCSWFLGLCILLRSFPAFCRGRVSRGGLLTVGIMVDLWMGFLLPNWELLGGGVEMVDLRPGNGFCVMVVSLYTLSSWGAFLVYWGWICVNLT